MKQTSQGRSARLVVPEQLGRNSLRAQQHGAEHTGRILIDLVLERLKLASLADSDVLDVGCGVRFAQTLLNLDIAFRSYTGIDVHRPLVEFLVREVSDPRCRFAHWDVHNAMYNPGATTTMAQSTALPVEGTYDLVWLFSVFTHLALHDANAMLALLRRYMRPEGRLFFTAFIGSNVDRFEDRDAPQQPLLRAFYSETYLRELVVGNGWEIDALYPRDTARFIQHHFVCRPA